jgi:hypothetical protein
MPLKSPAYASLVKVKWGRSPKVQMTSAQARAKAMRRLIFSWPVMPQYSPSKYS